MDLTSILASAALLGLVWWIAKNLRRYRDDETADDIGRPGQVLEEVAREAEINLIADSRASFLPVLAALREYDFVASVYDSSGTGFEATITLTDQRQVRVKREPKWHLDSGRYIIVRSNLPHVTYRVIIPCLPNGTQEENCANLEEVGRFLTFIAEHPHMGRSNVAQ